MANSIPNRINPSRPARFHRVRALAVTVLAAGTTVATLAPVTSAAGTARDLDYPGFGQPTASR